MLTFVLAVDSPPFQRGFLIFLRPSVCTGKAAKASIDLVNDSVTCLRPDLVY